MNKECTSAHCDFLGELIEIGDLVVFYDIKGKANAKGIVTCLKKVKVSIEVLDFEDNYNTRMKNGDVILRFPNQLIKIK